jgi:uncharacterized hydrophobic protein (TIGR00271 family)
MPEEKEFSIKASDLKIAVDTLFEKSRLNWDFYIMLILSAVIVSLGLLLNNATIIIGGMLVTPLLSPLLVFALGIVVKDMKVIWRSFRVLYKAIGIVLLVSVIMALVTPGSDAQSELMSRTFMNISFFYVALAAGVAAAYAWAKPNLSDVLPGIAISVAMLPPLVTMGIGIAKWSQTLALGGLRLFIGNIIGIVIASALVFALMGFHRGKKEAATIVKEEEKEEIKKEMEKVKEQETLIKQAEKEANYKKNKNKD